MSAPRAPTVAEPIRPAPQATFITGIVLAAGASTRMKTDEPKQLLRRDGRTLLEYVLEHARAAQFDELVLVLGHRAQSIRRALAGDGLGDFHIVIAKDYLHGQSRSLRAGLAAADPRATAAAVLLGDQPGVDTDTIDRVIDTWKARRPLLLRPQYEEGHENILPGHPVVIHRSVWPAAESLRKDEGAREIIRRHPDWLETLPLPGPRPPDLDTPDDWKQWLSSN